MAFLSESFDINELPQGAGSFDPLPAGWYSTSIQGAELKKTSTGTGEYISVKYAITGPTHQGRTVFGNLNIKNPNPKAEEIGRQQLGELMRAIGLARVTDTDQLIGGQLQIKLAVTPERTDERTGKTYDPSNEVKGFKSLTGSSPAASIPQAAAAQATAKATPPWVKK